MNTDEQYVPDEEDVRTDYAIGGARDTIGDIDYSAIPDLEAEFDRFLARVRRDAAREAEAERDEWRQTALDERAAALDALDQIKVRDARIKAVLALFGLEVGDA